MFFAAIVLLVAGQVVSGDQQQQLALSSASLDFSLRLYQRIATNEDSIVYSPYSIHSALSMTSRGARGATATQMKKTLGVTSMGKSLHTTYKELIQQYTFSVTDVRVHTGNALFINPHFTIDPEFKEDTEENYFAMTDNIDLSAKGGPEKPINDYIADMTENMIKDVLPQGSINSLTAMLLINTIFFNGTWLFPFEIRSTKNQNFKLQDGTVKNVKMMRGNLKVKIKRDNSNGVDVAEFPFTGERFSMYIALPQEDDGFADLAMLLAEPKIVEEFFTGLELEHVAVAIPKFRIESSLDLKGPLVDMGMTNAFNARKANFKAITTDKVFIDAVLHKAMIDVKESGTVAAAATVVKFYFKSSSPLRPTTSFVADHPFLFFLRDKQTRQILFQGKFSG